jgi:hypothetical protein
MLGWMEAVWDTVPPPPPLLLAVSSCTLRNPY